MKYRDFVDQDMNGRGLHPRGDWQEVQWAKGLTSMTRTYCGVDSGAQLTVLLHSHGNYNIFDWEDSEVLDCPDE